jgi:hypothetical protein
MIFNNCIERSSSSLSSSRNWRFSIVLRVVFLASHLRDLGMMPGNKSKSMDFVLYTNSEAIFSTTRRKKERSEE